MREHSTCSDTVLVEALRDGRLGERERASVERHLGRCAACRAHRDYLDGLSRELASIDPVPPLAHARARAAVLREAAQTVAAPRRRRLQPLMVCIAMLLVVGVAWGIAGQREPTVLESAPPSAGIAPSAHDEARRAVAPSQALVVTSAPEASAEAPSPEAPHAPATGTAAATARSSASAGARQDAAARAFAKAVERVGAGDFDVATEELERFSIEHPSDARVDEADYLIAIALERAGKVDQAAAAARRYLDAHPQGAHRAEAATIARRGSTP